MSNDATIYEGVLPAYQEEQTAENTTSCAAAPSPSILMLNRVLECGHIPASTENINLPKSAWKQIQARLASVF